MINNHTGLRKIAATAVTVVALGTIFTACSSSSNASPKGAPKSVVATSCGGKYTPIRLASLNSNPGFLIWAANDLGYFKKYCLTVSNLTFYATGPDEVSTGYAGAWDAGYMGGPPAIDSGIKFGLLTAGVLDWQKTNYEVFIRKSVGNVDLHSYLSGKTALTATASNMQFFLDACLAHYGVAESAVHYVNLSPPNIVSAAGGGSGQIISDWAPYTDQLQATGAYRPICTSDSQVGIHTFDSYVVQPSYARAHPRATAEFLAAVYSVNKLMRDDYSKMLQLSYTYFNDEGITLPHKEIAEGFTVMAYPSIQTALGYINSGKVVANLDAAAKFLVQVGALPNVPKIDFVTAKYLKEALKLNPSL